MSSQPEKPVLRLDWCSYRAAKYAVEHWHYSRSIVALTKHAAAVSRIVALALRFLCRQSAGLRLVVSYADPAHGHAGGIYQAGNWVYTGTSSPDFAVIDATGKRWHSRMVSKTGVKKCFGQYKRVIRPQDGARVELPGKHRYLMPLDDEMRRRIEPLRKPYPKRAGSDTKDTPCHRQGEGGPTPTPALQLNEQA